MDKTVKTSVDKVVYKIGFEDGVKATQDALTNTMNKLWKQYEADTYNVPKPDFFSAVALVSIADYIVRGEVK